MSYVFFSNLDLVRLNLLTDEQLYILNQTLCEMVHEVKTNLFHVLSSTELICEAVTLAETAAKEVCDRNGFWPVPTSGEYSRTGITYDTPKYRMWMRSQAKNVKWDKRFLFGFSFFEDLLDLVSTKPVSC